MSRPEDRKVLVVDDDPDVAFYLSTALEDVGFRVEVAFSVDEALERVRNGPPDFISLDMVMPQKSGIVLFHELRRHPEWKKIPVLFVTGKARDPHVRRDLDAALADSSMSGPSTYLEKPVTLSKFLQAVADALHVDLAAPGKPDETESLRDLRDDLKRLAETADPKALQDALALLKKRSDV